MTNLPQLAKSARVGKQQLEALIRSPGVFEGGAHRKVIKGTWEVLSGGGVSCKPSLEDITDWVPSRKSEESIVLRKSGNTDGGKGLYCEYVSIKRRRPA